MLLPCALPCNYYRGLFFYRLMYVKQRRDRSSVQGKTEIKNNVIDEKSVQLEDVQTTHM